MRWGPPLPIPNREVKPTSADGTGFPGEYVVAIFLFLSPDFCRGFFYALIFYATCFSCSHFRIFDFPQLLALRVLFVIPSITSYFTFLEDLAGVLHSRGHDVHLATSTRHITETNAYKRGMVATLHTIDFPRALNISDHLKASKALRKLVRDIQPDVISVHFSAALFTTALAKSGDERKWPKTIGMVHGLGSPTISGWRKWAISQAENWYATRFDELYVLTKEDQDHLLARVPGAPVKLLESFGLGCDLDRFKSQNLLPEEQQRLRRMHGIGTEDFVYTFIGRQTYFKGFDKVVRAFLQIYPQDFRQKLLLVGNKDRIHPMHLSADEAREIETHPGIIRTGWKENVEQYLAISHLNVFPSVREGLPVNLMESLAMGVPVITINSRGCRDVVRHGIDGLVLTDLSVEALAHAMTYLRDNHEVRNNFSEQAVADRDRFDRNRFIEAQFKTFERLTGMEV